MFRRSKRMIRFPERNKEEERKGKWENGRQKERRRKRGKEGFDRKA